jgi:hypothetical protein
MLEYVVDYLGFGEDFWMLGDQDSWEPRPYSEEKYRKEGRGTIGEPFNLTLTSHCNSRARDGWRLHSMTPNATCAIPSGYVQMMGMWVVFERARS